MHSITNESVSESSEEDQDTVSCAKVTKASARGMKSAEYNA